MHAKTVSPWRATGGGLGVTGDFKIQDEGDDLKGTFPEGPLLPQAVIYQRKPRPTV